MSLTLAYSIARGALQTGAAAASVVSRNVANAGEPESARKTLLTEAGALGDLHARIVSEIDAGLLERALESASARSELSVISDALDRLASVSGASDASTGPVARIGALRDALQAAAAVPHDSMALQGALHAATGVTAALNHAAGLADRIRADASRGLDTALEELGALLGAFAAANSAIVAGTQQGADVTDRIDERNALLRSLAELIDLRPDVRGGNDMMLFLANGVTLFESTAREIVIGQPGPPSPGQPGAPLRIDGIALGAAESIGGRIGGLLTVRDEKTLTFTRQLDEIARGLIVATAEQDQSGASLPTLAGLFTYPGGQALPPSGVLVEGLAAGLRIAASVDPAQGGVLARLRDGGISDPGDPAYVHNATGAAGFSTRLIELIERLSASQPFDPGAGISTGPIGVLAYAADSAGWLEATRAGNHEQLESKRVLAERTLGAWQSRIGVDLDGELAALIALERSYQASSRLISSVDGMFDALLLAIR